MNIWEKDGKGHISSYNLYFARKRLRGELCKPECGMLLPGDFVFRFGQQPGRLLKSLQPYLLTPGGRPALPQEPLGRRFSTPPGPVATCVRGVGGQGAGEGAAQAGGACQDGAAKTGHPHLWTWTRLTQYLRTWDMSIHDPIKTGTSRTFQMISLESLNGPTGLRRRK